MKKSLTRRAVDAILRSRSKTKDRRHWLSIRASSRRFGLDVSGVSRALKRRLTLKRCIKCGQVIR